MRSIEEDRSESLGATDVDAVADTIVQRLRAGDDPSFVGETLRRIYKRGRADVLYETSKMFLRTVEDGES